MIKKYLACLALISLCIETCAQTKVFVYYVSHNEDNANYLNGVMGRNNYINTRNTLVTICDSLQVKGAKYNHGSDHVFPRAVVQYDTGTVISSTNNKNIMQWMTQDKGMICDPHAHESTYNYADVAYLFTQAGITPTNTMSGFLCCQLQNGTSWDSYQNGVVGDSFPSYTWYPEILWGGATPGHVNDPNYTGVYKPQNMNNFSVHDANNHLILCGTGCAVKIDDTSTVAYKIYQIRRVINAINTGILPANGIYPQEIFFGEGKINQPWFQPFLYELTDSINAMVANGEVEWKNIHEIVDYWKTTYNEQPFAADCDFNIIIQPTTVEKTELPVTDLTIYPNPFYSAFHIQHATYTIGTKITVLNVYGKEIFLGKLESTTHEQQTLSWPSGIYFVSINNHIKKIVKL